MDRYGHLEGMLDRDLRTAKMPFIRIFNEDYDNSFFKSNELAGNPNKISSQQCCCPRNFSTSHFKSKKRYLLRTFKNFRNILVVGLYFILVALPPASSAPSSLCVSMDQEPNWNYSCGSTSLKPNRGTIESNVPGHLSDEELNELVETSDIQFTTVTKFIKNYTVKIFKKPFEEVDDLFKVQDYKWLEKPESWRGPKMPKHDYSLLDAYQYFQKIAVGLEQAIYDQERGRSRDLDFCKMYSSVIAVLCEIHEVIVDRDVPMRANVVRDVMGSEFRKMDETERRQRNFIILRDYRDALSYTIQSFNSTYG